MEESKSLMRPSERYDEVDVEDNFSESTRVSSFADEKTFEKLSRKASDRRIESVLTWGRWLVVVTLQFILIMLVLLLWKQPQPRISHETVSELKGKFVETGDDVNGLYTTTLHDYTYLKFEPEKYFPNISSNDNRDEVRRNWDMLMPKGSGSVAIPEYKKYPLLGNPITDDPLRSGPLFEASWTHAIHCLYYAVDSYHQLLLNGPSEADNPHHASHCFEYLRTSILCNLDMTLEGELSTPAEAARGQPHVCRNRDAAIKWIEDRRVDDLQDVVGPTAIPKDSPAGTR
ncbi:uncharacterized protein PV09_09513 [Verruconis gallopava]|uniref:Uncharacterized protein n=1 Tax=Verruconis gallopava TaxID=253628 RepID=A0A0D1X9B0_9PEZI|nr:uncharacterized protein PV09_09513 [Verruconis gallopava]KIV98730.1 hypothetical protein PV09_09513 [Verruconis gallopava]